MIGYVVLALGTALLWLAGFSISKRELFAPESVFFLGFFAAILMAVIGMPTWNNVALTSGLVAILMSAEGAFLVGSLLVEKAFSRVGLGRDASAPMPYVTPYWKFGILALVLVVSICVRVAETYRVAEELGVHGANFFSVVKQVREELAIFNSSQAVRSDVGYSLVARQLEKVSIAIGYVSTFLLAKAVSSGDRSFGRLAPPLAVTTLAVASVMLGGGRATVMFMVVAFLAYSAFLEYGSGRDPMRVSLKYLVICVILAFAGAVAFYLMSFLVGRGTGSGIVEYVSFYFGCGIPSFQQFLDTSSPEVGVPGLRSFYTLYAFLYKVGIMDSLPSYSIDWVALGGHKSNVFTGFARYFLDFGLAGTVVLSTLAGALLTAVYRIAREKNAPALVAVAGFMTPYIFDMAREEFVFSRLLSTSYVLIVALIVLFTVFCTQSVGMWRRKTAQP